jgi:hypothetical protein
VQPVPIQGLPALPDADVLAQRTIAAARHVAEDPVEQELTRRLFDRPTFFDRRRSKDRIDRRVQIGDHQRGTWEAGRLVDEKMGSSGIAVVGDEEAGGC